MNTSPFFKPFEKMAASLTLDSENEIGMPHLVGRLGL